MCNTINSGIEVPEKMYPKMRKFQKYDIYYVQYQTSHTPTNVSSTMIPVVAVGYERGLAGVKGVWK